jgi:hypothetical protein
MTHTVKATREGLVGQGTSSGWRITTSVPAVALPSHAALWAWVLVTNPMNGKSIKARVLDTGPWNTMDDAYVFASDRPLAEKGISLSGKGTNGAGIDLSEAVWSALGMEDNGSVTWEFV